MQHADCDAIPMTPFNSSIQLLFLARSKVQGVCAGSSSPTLPRSSLLSCPFQREERQLRDRIRYDAVYFSRIPVLLIFMSLGWIGVLILYDVLQSGLWGRDHDLFSAFRVHGTRGGQREKRCFRPEASGHGGREASHNNMPWEKRP